MPSEGRRVNGGEPNTGEQRDGKKPRFVGITPAPPPQPAPAPPRRPVSPYDTEDHGSEQVLTPTLTIFQEFTDDYADFPASGPLGHPHIIDINAFRSQKADTLQVLIWDAVATVLFKHSEDTLAKFLDPEVVEFTMFSKRFISDDFTRQFKAVVIKRKRNQVLIGRCANFPVPNSALEEYWWNILIRCTIEKTDTWTDGTWNVDYVLHDQISRDRPEDRVITTRSGSGMSVLVDGQSVGLDSRIVLDMKDQAYYTDQLGRYMLSEDIWVDSSEREVTV